VRFSLKPGTYILVGAEDFIYVIGKSAKLKIRIPVKYRQRVVRLLVSGTSVASLSRATDAVSAKTLYDMLQAKSLIRAVCPAAKEGTSLEKTEIYFSQYCDSPVIGLERLASAHVAVVGLGGIGCVLVEQLVACGVKNFTCIDFDRVSITNLNRQFCFTPESVGRRKTYEIKKYIMSRSSQAKVSLVDSKITSLPKFSSIMAKAHTIPPVNFVACCADLPRNRINSIITAYCLEKDLPCSFCGVGIYDGIFGPLLRSGDEKRRYLGFLDDAEGAKMFPAVTSGSIGFTNSLIAILFAKDIAMSIAGVPEFKSRAAIVNVDFDDLSAATVKSFR